MLYILIWGPKTALPVGNVRGSAVQRFAFGAYDGTSGRACPLADCSSVCNMATAGVRLDKMEENGMRSVIKF